MTSRNKMLLLLVLVLPSLAYGQTCKSCAAGDVTVDKTSGAYKDILIVVDKDVSYDTLMVQNIKVPVCSNQSYIIMLKENNLLLKTII